MSSQVITLKTDEAVNWFQKRLKNALNYGLSSEELKLFEIFITSTLTDVDIKKQITNTILPTFYENLLSRTVNKPAIDAQASAIRLFMKYYGGTCGQFKNTLDKFTTKILKECFNEDNIVLKVTKYLALYSQCGSRGQQGINHAEAWTNQFNDYLYSSNYFLHQLYSNVNFFSEVEITDKYEGKFDISVFSLSELRQITPKERYEKLTSIFIFFNMTIQSMLLSMFSTVKHFDSNKVIQLVLNTLSVNSEKLNATIITEDVIALDSVLWKLHCSALKTISALIKCCGRLLIPYGTLICRLLLQSLNMTHSNSSNFVYGTTRSNLQQRVLTYQVLYSWLAVAGSQSSLEMFSESFISGILLDIKYDKPSLNLVVDKQTGKKRKSGALNEKIINQRDTIVMHDYHANKSICNEAHTTLQLFLNTMCFNLKSLQFKIFQSTIMGLLLEIIKCQRSNDYPLPYYDDLCRLNLYKSLLVIVTSPHPQCITHTNVALRIFTLGTTDRNEKIKEICRSSLTKLEHIIRPRNDTLFFPLENELEIPKATQNVIPDNKTYFLNDVIKDSVLIHNKEKQLQDSNTDEIKTIMEPETSSSNVEITNVKYPNADNDTQIVNSNLNNKSSPVKSLNISLVQENKIIEPTDVISDLEMSKFKQSENINEEQDDSVVDMLNDFIDSD